MDPGTALGVASLAHAVTKDLYKYYQAWKDCDQDVKELRVRLLWLNDAFRRAKDVIAERSLPAGDLHLVCGALANCTDATNELRDILDRIRKEGDPQRVREKLRVLARRLFYPFMKATVGQILDQVESCVAGLDLVLGILQLDTWTQQFKKLKELDKKLVAIDTALQPLPTILSDIVTVKDQTTSVKADTAAIVDHQSYEAQQATLKKAMHWICSADYSQQQNYFYARRDGDTCIWLLESPEFLAWRDGKIDTLVCHGQPGAGKTILAATAIHELLHTEDVKDVGIAYLFCNYKRQQEQDSTHCLAALVRQLLYRTKRIPNSFEELFHRHTERNTHLSRGELVGILSCLVQEFTVTYLLIDALDECERNVCREVLSSIQHQPRNDKLRLMVTTRPVQDVLDHFPSSPCLEVRASAHDVDVYIRTRMETLPGFVQKDLELQTATVSAIVSAVDGMFLLAQFHMASLGDCLTRKAFRKALAALPKGSNTAVYAAVYSETMDRIDRKGAERAALAKNALSWIVFAKCPLRSKELLHGLAVNIDAQDCELDEDDLYDMGLVISSCAGLIAADEESHTVRLVHYTAQKFFEENGKVWLPNAESTLALKCIKYLSLQSCTEGRYSNDNETSIHVESYPLHAYAVEHWAMHVSSSAIAEDTAAYTLVEDAALRFLQDTKLIQAAMQMDDIWLRAKRLSRSPSGWHIIARFGVETLVPGLLKADPVVDCRDDRGRTPLSYAAEFGHVGFVRLLVDLAKATPDADDEDGRTPLWYAAMNGDEVPVKLLMRTRRWFSCFSRWTRSISTQKMMTVSSHYNTRKRGGT